MATLVEQSETMRSLRFLLSRLKFLLSSNGTGAVVYLMEDNFIKNDMIAITANPCFRVLAHHKGKKR